jgi:hypothetical protein
VFDEGKKFLPQSSLGGAFSVLRLELPLNSRKNEVETATEIFQRQTL